MELNILYNYEFKEVLNTFPVLKEVLDSLDINLEDIQERETMNDYFTRKSLSEEEVNIIIRKMNRKLKLHFDKNKEGKKPPKLKKLKVKKEEE